MSLRFSPNRSFLQQSLSAVVLRLENLSPRQSAFDQIDPRWQPELARIRQEINGDNLNRDAIIYRAVRLAQQLVGASGAGVWLLADDDIFYCEGTGSASNDERLRIEVLSELAVACAYNKPHRPGKPSAAPTDGEAGNGHIWARSLIVEPIWLGQDIAGILAAFSAEPNIFGERDTANIHALASLLSQTLSKVAAMGMDPVVALKPEAVAQLVARIIPSLLRMVEMDERYSDANFLRGGHEQNPVTPDPETNQHYASLEESPAAQAQSEVLGGPELGDPSVQTGFEDHDTSSAAERNGQEVVVATTSLLQSGAQSLVRLFASLRNSVTHALEAVRRTRSQYLSGVARSAISESRDVTPPSSSDSPNRSMWAVSRGLKQACDSLLEAVKSVSSQLQAALDFGPGVRMVIAAVPAILAVIIIIFPMLKTDRHRGPETAASGSQTAPTVSATPSSAGETGYVETEIQEGIVNAGTRDSSVAPSESTTPLQASHLRITDRATESVLRTLSRYELAGLQRRAEFGDDSAALQIGMAYEIGHGVSPNCKTAARWIARAAAAGNAAAQYNLGLRFRDGDGVPMNEEAAVKWLREAASHRSSDARIALATLTAHQTPSDAPSQP